MLPLLPLLLLLLLVIIVAVNGECATVPLVPCVKTEEPMTTGGTGVLFTPLFIFTPSVAVVAVVVRVVRGVVIELRKNGELSVVGVRVVVVVLYGLANKNPPDWVLT